jgi:hypothetical protein
VTLILGGMKLRLNRRMVMLAACTVGLLAAGFTMGILRGHHDFADARVSWSLERDRLQTAVDAGNRLASSLRAQEALWELDAEISAVLSDLADKNFGLARDEVATANSLLSKADLPAEAAKTLAPLGSLLVDIGRSADGLSADARASAEQARALVRGAIDGIVAAAGA